MSLILKHLIKPFFSFRILIYQPEALPFVKIMWYLISVQTLRKHAVILSFLKIIFLIPCFVRNGIVIHIPYENYFLSVFHV